MPMKWLLKSDPDEYSFDHLVKDGTATWDGVKNPVASKHLGEMRKGEDIVVYHTGKEKAAVGLARVAGAPHPDPKNAAFNVVPLAAGKRLEKPISLSEIKASPLFAESPLLRMGRLSVVPLTDEQYRFLTGG